MPDCRQCGEPLDDADNFCARCGAPQNRKARERLQSYVRQQVRRRSTAESTADDGDDALERRLSYVVGYAGVVAALATLPSLAGACFLLAGLFVLPPVRRVAGRALLDRPVSPLVAGAVFAVLAGAGVVALRFA